MTLYIDNDGLHAHTPKGKKQNGPHFELAVLPRQIYRAVCACGKVFENGNESKVRRRLANHIKNKKDTSVSANGG
jgi:hypothetical protein